MTNGPEITRTNTADTKSSSLRFPPIEDLGSSSPANLESFTSMKDEFHEIFRSMKESESRMKESESRMKESESRIAEVQDYIRHVGFTPRVAKLLARQAQEFDSQPEEILLKALGLFSRAWEAEQSGQKIAILDPDDTIVAEIGGFTAPLALPTAR